MKVCLVSDNEFWLKHARRELADFEVVVMTDPQEFGGDVMVVMVVDAGCMSLVEGCAIPTIIVSGQPTTQEAIRAYRLGAVEYVGMDFTDGVLWNLVKWWVKRIEGWQGRRLS